MTDYSPRLMHVPYPCTRPSWTPLPRASKCPYVACDRPLCVSCYPCCCDHTCYENGTVYCPNCPCHSHPNSLLNSVLFQMSWCPHPPDCVCAQCRPMCACPPPCRSMPMRPTPGDSTVTHIMSHWQRGLNLFKSRLGLIPTESERRKLWFQSITGFRAPNTPSLGYIRERGGGKSIVNNRNQISLRGRIAKSGIPSQLHIEDSSLFHPKGKHPSLPKHPRRPTPFPFPKAAPGPKPMRIVNDQEAYKARQRQQRWIEQQQQMRARRMTPPKQNKDQPTEEIDAATTEASSATFFKDVQVPRTQPDMAGDYLRPPSPPVTTSQQVTCEDIGAE